MSHAPLKTRVLQEVESAWTVRHDAPEQVITRIAKLREIGEWRLIHARTLKLTDKYYDTAAHDLSQNRVALRVRTQDGEPRLALKGPSTRSRGVSKRFELDVPWSPRAAGRVMRSLVDFGQPLARRTASRAWRGPADFVRALDLSLVQRRDTRRLVRQVVALDAPLVLAELAIDTITYEVHDLPVRIGQVEVETRDPSGERAAAELPRLLAEQVGGALQDWPWPKVATGLALARLPRARLEKWRNPAGWLETRGIDALESALRSRKG